MICQHAGVSATLSETRLNNSATFGRRITGGAAALLLTVSTAAMMTGMMVGSARADCDFPTNGDDTLTCDADFGGGFGVNALDGNDTVNITGGTYTNTITGGNGQDTITLNDGTLQMEIMGQGNSDVINLNGGTADAVLGDGPDDGGGENDQFEIFVVFVPEPGAADTITLNGSTIVNDINGNEEDDTILLLSGSVGGGVFGDTGNDTITLSGADTGGTIGGGEGDDQINLQAGPLKVTGQVLGNAGNDTITLDGLSMFSNIRGGTGNDAIDLIFGFAGGGVFGDEGEDAITLNGAIVQFSIHGGDENDTIDLLAGVAGGAQGDAGEDIIALNGASIGFSILGGSGNDTVTLSSGTVGSDIRGNDGDDAITLIGASVIGEIKGDDGTDMISLLAGSAGRVEGNNGMDTILLDGATVTGDILGQGLSDSITLNSGSVGGDVYGDGPDFIDGIVDLPGADSITLNGAMVAGTIYGNEEADTIALLSGSALTVAGGTGNDSVTLNGASITGYISGEDGADALILLGGAAGEVTGDAGNDTVTLAGASIGGMISGNDGDDRFNLISGSFGGNFEGGNGSDLALIEPTYDLATITGLLDGGDDALIGDGFIDILDIEASGSLTGNNLINWEAIFIDGASLTLGGTGLTTETANSFGVIVRMGSTLDLDDGFALVGDLTIDGTSVLRADTPGGTGVYSVSGDLNNNNLIDMSDGSGAGDTLSVGGNYFSASDLHLDVALNATEVGDSLVIGGSISGAPTEITFTDTDPFGPPSFTGMGPGNGILVVDNSAGGDIMEGDFVMNPIAHPDDEIVKAPFFYTLSLEPDDILYLQSDVLPQVYGYAILTELMREEFPILRERLGDRRYNGNGTPEPVLADTDNGGIWARIEGRRREIDHAGGFDTGEWEASRGEAEVGVDIPIDVGGGVGVFGVSTHFVQGFANAHSGLTTDPDIAKIDTTGFGAGLSFAYFPGGGFYADVQGRLTAWDADVEVVNRDLKQDVDAIGWGASLEVGNRLQFTPSATLTPRGQVIYTDVNFSDFTDDDGVEVSQDESASVVVEAGVTLEQMLADNGVAMFYDASVSHDVLGDSSIDASGFTFDSGLEDTWATVGMGAVMETGEGTSAYIQAELGTPLASSFGDSIGYALRAGVRVDF
jgi:outer membrane autotransporter protein